MHRFIPFIIPVLLTLSCFEEDKPVPPYPGKVTSIVDSVQTFLSYFDFETDNTVASQRNDAWQLGFECGANGWHIITNSGANWFLLNTGQPNPVEEPGFPVSHNHLYDVPHAYPDSTAAGDWVQFTGDIPEYTHEIYLLGHLLKGEYVNIIQVKFLGVNENAYTFYYKQHDGFSDTVTMQKDDRVNFVYFSFTDHAPVNIEPDKSTYDLVFAPYYDLATLFDNTIPYPVGGSYLNLFQTGAVLDSIQPYDEIDATMIPAYVFSYQRDIPGYRWKEPTVDVAGGGATYQVKTNYTYIFHTSDNNYFKLKFLSYSFDAKNGFPRFEFRQLE